MISAWINLQNIAERCFTLEIFVQMIKQDDRLAPAYFSQEYKYFDQHLPTVKNETTV